jgi:hypothetical protein
MGRILLVLTLIYIFLLSGMGVSIFINGCATSEKVTSNEMHMRLRANLTDMEAKKFIFRW